MIPFSSYLPRRHLWQRRIVLAFGSMAAADQADFSAAPLSPPREIYLQECEQRKVRVNSDVVRMLPATAANATWAHIQTLDLSRNCLGRRGMLPVLAVIRMCPNLRVLDLSDNYLSNDFVLELCATLKESSPHLTTLNLSRNPISYPAGKALLRLIRGGGKETLRAVLVEQTLMNPGLARLVTRTAQDRGTDDGAEDVEVATSGIALRAISSSSVPTNESKAHPKLHGLHALAEVSHQHATKASVAPEDDWYAMETMWNLAAAAAPREDGWAGLASVMALVRQDRTLATMYE
jgi:hypothetical protein